MTKIQSAVDFVYLFDVANGNPNGDPDADNMPRVLPDGRGLCTDTSVKYRIKTYLAALKNPNVNILGIRGNSIPDEINKVLKTLADTDNDNIVLQAACKAYYDVRAFGSVLNWKKPSKKDKTKEDKGYNNCPSAVQIFDALSVHPINICSAGRTCASIVDANANENSKGQGFIGPKHFLSYALYMGSGVVKPHQAETNGFSEEDLQLLWEGFERGFRMTASASKGRMNLRGLICFKHVGNGEAQAKFGCCPDYVLHNLLKITPQTETPTKFEDFNITLNKTACPAGVEIYQPVSNVRVVEQ